MEEPGGQMEARHLEVRKGAAGDKLAELGSLSKRATPHTA